MRLKKVSNKLKTNGHILGAVILGFLLLVVLSLFNLPPFLRFGLAVFIPFAVCRLFFGRLHPTDGEIILFWGLPRSGKSMFLQKIIRDNPKRPIGCNDEYYSVIKKHPNNVYLFQRQDWGRFRPLDNSILVIDEASLNGYDNRDWAINFDEESLSAWKKVGHNPASIVLTNQGFDELDCKIRDSLTSTVYWVENKGWYSKAVRMDKTVVWDENGKPTDGYTQPSLFERLFDPSSVLYVVHRFYGRFYNTHNPQLLPYITEKEKYTYIPDKNPKRTGKYILKDEYKNLDS